MKKNVLFAEQFCIESVQYIEHFKTNARKVTPWLPNHELSSIWFPFPMPYIIYIGAKLQKKRFMALF